jgi:L-asparaginase
VIRALVSSGVRGIVFAGTGAGLLSHIETATLNAVLDPDAAKRPVMVRSNRTGSGRVVSYPEFDKMGMIPADTLNPQKARILLMLALTRTRNLPDLIRIFSEY